MVELQLITTNPFASRTHSAGCPSHFRDCSHSVSVDSFWLSNFCQMSIQEFDILSITLVTWAQTAHLNSRHKPTTLTTDPKTRFLILPFPKSTPPGSPCQSLASPYFPVIWAKNLIITLTLFLPHLHIHQQNPIYFQTTFRIWPLLVIITVTTSCQQDPKLTSPIPPVALYNLNRAATKLL